MPLLKSAQAARVGSARGRADEAISAMPSEQPITFLTLPTTLEVADSDKLPVSDDEVGDARAATPPSARARVMRCA